MQHGADLKRPVSTCSPLLVVVGPTAAGKSELAVRLARALEGEVVSADSVQLYRGLDIGTGKLSPAERRGIPHHLLSILDPPEPFSAARFVRVADEVVTRISERGRQVVVAGGTGLYVRALLHGLFESPPPDPKLRAEHRRVAAEQGVGALHRRLAELDPEAAARIESNDLVRISRALEVRQQTGQTISALQRAHRFSSRRYAAVQLGLNPGWAVLRERIERRVQEMMERGWLEEVRALLQAGHAATRPMGSLGYRQLLAHLRGELDLDEAVRQTVRDTRRYARRQLAWFSSEPEIHWHGEADQVKMDEVRAWLDHCGVISGSDQGGASGGTRA